MSIMFLLFQGDFGDVSGRKALRETLGCKSFKWYIDNVYPELFIPGNSVASGEVSDKISVVLKLYLNCKIINIVILV